MDTGRFWVQLKKTLDNLGMCMTLVWYVYDISMVRV